MHGSCLSLLTDRQEHDPENLSTVSSHIIKSRNRA